MNGRVAAVLGAAVARRFAGEGFAVAMMARRVGGQHPSVGCRRPPHPRGPRWW